MHDLIVENEAQIIPYVEKRTKRHDAQSGIIPVFTRCGYTVGYILHTFLGDR
jgi:hypothetical protein